MQADINYEYKEALAQATARERAERIISCMVVKGTDVTEEEAERIYQRELRKVSRKFTHMRYHSFLMYFGVLKRLDGWKPPTKQSRLPYKITTHQLALQGKDQEVALRWVEREIDRQAAKLWGLTDDELARVSSFREIG